VLLPVVRQLRDSVEQDHYVSELAKLLGVSKEALSTKLKGQSTGKKQLKTSKTEVVIDRQEAERTKSQDQLLAICLQQPPLREYLDPIRPGMLVSEDARIILRKLQADPAFVFFADNLAKSLKISEEYVKILVLIYEALYQDLEDVELVYEAARLQARLIEQYAKIKKSELALAMQSANDQTTKSLLAQAKEVDELLNKTKGD
jgi:DNA primase